MIIEIISGLIIGGVLAYVFWDELKAWALSAFEYLVDEIVADYIIDYITGGLISFIRVAGGFLKKTRYFRRIYAYFTSAGERYFQKIDEEVPRSKLPSEILSSLEGQSELPVLRIEV